MAGRRACAECCSISQHGIGEAVAVARLIGVPAAVHVGEIETPDGAQRAGVGEEFADRGGAADLHAEGVGLPQEMADVPSTSLRTGFGRLDAASEERVV